MRPGQTVTGGVVIPEKEVSRGDPAVSAPFQVREAATVYLGPRGGRIRAPAGETGPAIPGRTFRAREAVTVTQPPPHWARLTEQQEKENDDAHYPGPDPNCRETGIG